MLTHRLVLAMVLLVGGVVSAHEGDDDPSKVHACVRKKGGRLRVVGATAKGGCKKKERALHLNVQGPAGAAGMVGGVGTPGTPAWERPCPPDSTRVGTACIDTYEASIWRVPDPALVDRVREGTATLAELTAAGATQFGCTKYGQAEFPATFPVTGNWTEQLYAASIPGVIPTACVSWFQAAQACALSGKRLPTNDEWQLGAAGTPDGAPCIVDSPTSALQTGTPGCVSSWGLFDMVGNVWEAVGGWGDRAMVGSCTNWSAAFGGDFSCVGGDGSTATKQLPGILRRGGGWDWKAEAGVFAVSATSSPDLQGGDDGGFRCAR